MQRKSPVVTPYAFFTNIPQLPRPQNLRIVCTSIYLHFFADSDHCSLPSRYQEMTGKNWQNRMEIRKMWIVLGWWGKWMLHVSGPIAKLAKKHFSQVIHSWDNYRVSTHLTLPNGQSNVRTTLLPMRSKFNLSLRNPLCKIRCTSLMYVLVSPVILIVFWGPAITDSHQQ